MIYADDAAQPTQIIPTSAERQQQLVLSDREILTLARWAMVIEDHYQRPMDIEWAKDGQRNELFIV